MVLRHTTPLNQDGKPAQTEYDGFNPVVYPKPVTTPTVYNVTLTVADTEYSQALSADTREYRFRCRTLFDVRFAFETGKVAIPTAPYLTLPGGSDYWSDNDKLAATTLYFATDEAGVVLEIETWK